MAENNKGLFVVQATRLLQVSWGPKLTGTVSNHYGRE